MEVPTPAAFRPLRAFKARSRAGGASSIAERAGVGPARAEASPVFETGSAANRIAAPEMTSHDGKIVSVSKRLPQPENRACEDCSGLFVTSWAQRLCNPCKYGRAARSACDTCGRKTGQTGRRQCGSCRYGTPPELRAMSSPELAWLAGIVEGEGTFGLARRPGGQVRVVMTDQDIIRRLWCLTGLGLIHNRGRRAAHHKTVWEWAVTRRENVCTLAGELAPLLLQRRRAAIEAILRAGGRVLPPPVEFQPGTGEAWAWVAGLLEGEGWISPAPNSIRQGVAVAVQSTDFDTIERLAALTQVGSIVDLKRRSANHKPSRRWGVRSHADARLVLAATLPWLGERRTARARYVLDRIGAESGRFELPKVLPFPAFRAGAMTARRTLQGRKAEQSKLKV
jgi:hypothetical protein